MPEPENRIELLHQLLGPLHMHFKAAKAAYHRYLSNGKSFLFAVSLRRINSSARQLLLDKGYLLPEERQADAVALIEHYDVWLTLWDDLASRGPIAFGEPFVFENKVNYPRDSEQRLGELYRMLTAAAENVLRTGSGSIG